jgi:ABC-type Fe3+ transport system permease subunit
VSELGANVLAVACVAAVFALPFLQALRERRRAQQLAGRSHRPRAYRERRIFSGLDAVLLLFGGFCIRTIGDPRSGALQISAAVVGAGVAVWRVHRATRPCADTAKMDEGD